MAYVEGVFNLKVTNKYFESGTVTAKTSAHYMMKQLDNAGKTLTINVTNTLTNETKTFGNEFLETYLGNRRSPGKFGEFAVFEFGNLLNTAPKPKERTSPKVIIKKQQKIVKRTQEGENAVNICMALKDASENLISQRQLALELKIHASRFSMLQHLDFLQPSAKQGREIFYKIDDVLIIMDDPRIINMLQNLSGEFTGEEE